MAFKKIWIVLFLIFFLFPIYKVHGETSNAGFVPANINPELNTTDPSQIEKIRDIIVEKTPTFIAKPIANAAKAIEKFRENIGVTSENKKQEVKTEIKALEENNNEILKPFKYVKLFAFTLASAVFNNKFIFYGILIIGIFLLFRWFWLKIF